MPVTTSLLSPVPLFLFSFLNCKSGIRICRFSRGFIFAFFFPCLCSISRFLGAFITDSPSRYYVILLYIVILNGGKGVSLGESFT
ncbi:hypothetical protein VN97_g12252 [Penicillium thymicola]|uniref:Uncharacterized protein n=1 Tax=Penicillium thymicola TaxID=293382 RepID=A0AAI9X274_PENTH|nr:hypothetical protein VN97_g12252 [Penicillium thymicola]